MRWTAVLLACLLVSTPAFSAVSSVMTHTFQSAAVATGNGTVLDVSKYNSLAVQIIIATTATVTFEGTVDNSNWISLACTSIASTSATLVTSATASGLYQCNTAGLSTVRMRISSWGSGAVTVTGVLTTAVASKKGGGGSALTVQENDGTPSVSSVGTINFTNGTVTDNGSGSVSVTISGTGAPTDSPYITSTAVAGLSAEVPLSGLSTGCVGVTTTTGALAGRTITGTANQISVANGDCSAAPTLSIPTNPTLPGTTTGTFSGNLTGNVTGTASLATALAANGANCSAGSYPLGVDASGAVESCTAAGTGTVTSVATTSPLGGGTITGTGTLTCTTCTTNASALTANLPVIGGGGQAAAVGTRSGNTTQFVTTTGTQTSGDCVKIDASGNHIANGSACGSGGTGTVTHTAGALTVQGIVAGAGAADTVIFGPCSDGLVPSWASGVLTCSSIDAAPSTATYLMQTANSGTSAEQALGSLSSGCLSVTTTTGVVASTGAACATGTVTSVATTSPITGGTITGTGTIACATCVTAASALTANLPMIGGGSQAAAVGTRSGNTTQFVTTTGTQTSGDCVKIDASGNHVANGSACGVAGSATYSFLLTPATQNPVASTTYWISSSNFTSVENVVKFHAPMTGNVTGLKVHIYAGGVTGAGGTTTAFKVHNSTASTTSTGCTINITTSDLTCTDTNAFAITANDMLAVEMITQAWTTAPTNVSISIEVLIGA